MKKDSVSVVLAMVCALFFFGCQKNLVQEVSLKNQTLEMETLGNARELGGYRTADGRMVRRGLLLRSAKPCQASENDIKRLLNEYHLGTIVDFRMTMERQEEPSPEIPGVKSVWLRIIDEKVLSDLRALMKETVGEQAIPKTPIEKLDYAIKSGIVSDRMYIDFVSSETGKTGYRQFFKELLALPEGKSLLFHCTQGKDRTGLAAMLVLSALGVDEDVIMRDYVLTNEFNKTLIEKEKAMLASFGLPEEKQMRYLSVMDQVNPKYMQNVIDYLKDEFGSVLNYITNALEITPDEIERLKEKFLTGSPDAGK